MASYELTLTATVKEDQPSMENTGLQLASPATPAKDVPLTQYEAETAAILEQKAIRQSLLDAALERELVVITDRWSETVQ